ncbi:MAG: MBL fold metallo-hydrolase [Bacilli bacterium]|nr:MBL fold metallo-hydrolase [Bacillales bacterium]MDY2575541.1 MBL fold metallo-hydrolase [Bacilli bacterium]
MQYHIFESGSKGNCTLISSKGRYLLIDMGISKRKLKSKLEEINVDINKVDHVLLTHSHIDHISGIDFFDKSQIFTTRDVIEGLPLSNQLIPYQSYKINGFNVLVLPTSHDSDGSIGFVIEDENEKLVYITDTGYLFEKVVELIKDATYYIFESNHNVKMLIETNRPQSLKKRIMGDYGHLSNDDSANYLCDVVSSNTKEIVLAHLSEEANSPEQALCDLMKVFKKRGVDFDKYYIRCASQKDTVSGGKVEVEA